MPTNNFKVGELLNKRSLNSKTWINFDGSYTAEIYNSQVHFEDENGNLQNINTDLFDEADLDLIDEPVAKEGHDRFKVARDRARDDKKKGKLDRDLYDFQGLKVPFDARIPRNFKRGYTIGHGGNRLKFRPVNASPSKGYVDEDQTNRIHFQDAWNDADVLLELTTMGIKETIVLKTDRAPSTFTFEVDGVLDDNLMSGALKLQPAWLQDANGEKRDVVQKTRTDGDQTFIDLEADVTGLVYPIFIDPTVNLSYTSITNDTYVRSDVPTASYGTQTNLAVGRTTSSVFWESYIKFDLSSIPSGAVISAATISVTAMSNMSGAAGDTFTFNVQTVTGAFSDTTTWNTKPTTMDNGDSSTTTGYSYANGTTYDLSATKATQYLMSHTNYGFALVSKTAGGANGAAKSFNSKEYTSSQPGLSVTYNVPPTAPVVTAPNGGETWNAQQTVAWNASSDPSTFSIGSIPTSGLASGNLTYGSSSNGKMLQQFTTPSDTTLLSTVYFRLQQGSASFSFNTEIWTVDANGNPGAKVGNTVSSTVTLLTTIALFSVTMGVQLSPNTNYVVVITATSGSSGIESTSVGQPGLSPYSKFYPNSGSGWAVSTNYYLNIKLDLTPPPSVLQYQIQLSTDNATNWKDIVALTTAGVTSYAYNFTNEAQSSTCLIRVRAYDGTDYGPWDQSNGVFTIQHNTAPTAPTNLTPTGALDRALIQRLGWKHNDPQNDTQSKFDLQWRLQGAGTWNTVTQSVVNQYWDAPASTFPKGTIEWQIRTYDQAGLSGPYSAISTFVASDKPANPTITAPTDNTTVSIATPTITWSSTDQTGYLLQVYDQAGITKLWESNKTASTNKAESVGYSLSNGSQYIIQLSIRNADGVYSNVMSSHITVSYTPPAKPTIVMSADNDRGAMLLNVTNPTPTGTQPTVTSADIYKMISGESIRIATGFVSGVFTDFTPRCGENEQYYIRAFGDNGTYIDSDIVTGLATLESSQLALVSDPSIWVKMKYSPDRGNKKSVERSLSQFAGRPNSMAEYGEHDDWWSDISFKLFNSGDLDILDQLVESRETLLYRDNNGRRQFVSVAAYDVKDNKSGYWEISLTVDKVYYVEVV